MQTTKDAMNKSIERLLESIEKRMRQSNGQVNVSHHMKCVTLDVISRLAFNMDDTDVHQDQSVLRDMASQFMDDTTNIVLELAAYFPILSTMVALYYNNFGGGRLISTISEQLNKCIIDYYQAKIKEKFAQTGGGGTKERSKETPKMNILDFMLEQQEQGNLDELEIIGLFTLIN